MFSHKGLKPNCLPGVRCNRIYFASDSATIYQWAGNKNIHWYWISLFVKGPLQCIGEMRMSPIKYSFLPTHHCHCILLSFYSMCPCIWYTAVICTLSGAHLLLMSLLLTALFTISTFLVNLS